MFITPIPPTSRLIAAIAAIAYAVYRYMTPSYEDDFDDDDFFDDFEDDAEDAAEDTGAATA